MEQTTMSATPRPWTVVRREPGPRGADGGYDIFDARNFPVLLLPDGEVNRQKADDIVRAVNTLDEAKAALEAMQKACDEWAAKFTQRKRTMNVDAYIDACIKCERVLAKMKEGVE